MRVMMQLDEQTLNSLKVSFMLHDDALDVTRFVDVLLEHLDDHGQDREELTRMFCELFAQIDIEDTGQVCWNDFTSYVVGAASGSAENVKGSHHHDIQSYVPSRKAFDQTHHANVIEQLIYLPALDRFVTSERAQRCFKVYDPARGFKVVHEVGGNEALRGCVLAADYIPSRHYLATASNDLTIGMYDTKHFKLQLRKKRKSRLELYGFSRARLGRPRGD